MAMSAMYILSDIMMIYPFIISFAVAFAHIISQMTKSIFLHGSVIRGMESIES